MAWYAAHAIVYFELNDGPQEGFQVYENVYLISAGTADEAWANAREVARRDEGDDCGSLRVGGRSARRVFGGIRKVISVLLEGADGQLGNGDELTYNELVVADRAVLDALIRGDDAEVLYAGGATRPTSEPTDEPEA